MIESRVAIIIPTINRPEFVERTVSYYRDVKSPHPIYIGDASEESMQLRLDEITLDTSLVVRYFHWPKVNDRKTQDLLGEEALMNGEKYVAYHGDDDYFIPNSLSICAEFLEKNPEYVTAQGKAALMNLDRNGPYGNIVSLVTYWEKQDLSGETPLERLDQILNNYWVPQFSVHRSSEYVEASRHHSEISEKMWGETLHCICFALQGKSKHLDNLYMVRNIHPGISHPSFVEKICSSSWYPSYQMTCEHIVRELNDPQITLSDIENRIKKYIEKEIKKSVTTAPNYSHDVKKTIKNIFPRLVSIKKFLEFKLKTPDDLSLLNQPKSKYFNDFVPVIKSLREPSDNI